MLWNYYFYHPRDVNLSISTPAREIRLIGAMYIRKTRVKIKLSNINQITMRVYVTYPDRTCLNFLFVRRIQRAPSNPGKRFKQLQVGKNIYRHERARCSTRICYYTLISHSRRNFIHCKKLLTRNRNVRFKYSHSRIVPCR